MKTRIMSVILLLLAIWASPLAAQFSGGLAIGAGLPYFQIRVISTFDSDTGDRLARIYTQIRNENLTFIKNDSGYVAEIQLDMFVNEKEEEFAFSKTINKSVFVENYDETISGEISNTFITDIPVNAGRYEVRVTAVDRNSSSQFSRNAKFEVTDPTDMNLRVTLSDVIFFNDYSTDDAGKIIDYQPAMSNSFSSESEFIYVNFSTYNKYPDEPTEIRYTVKDENNIVVMEHLYDLDSKEAYVEHFLKLSRYYLDRNQYLLELTVHNGDQWVVKNASFSFFWRFSPTTVQDLDLALRQMKYISEDDSIKYFLKKNYDEKKAYFDRFWNQRDPDPSSARNELMEEYFRRVNFANANFSSTNNTGWLNDRGRIFIKFGEPDDIERHPFEAETYPYQIWRYYSIQKVFLFIDRTGFGDYDLHPSYYYVEHD